MKKLSFLEPALAIGLVFALIIGARADMHQSALASKMMRLHVIAHSDSDADQALKLKVRDRVLSFSEKLLEGSENSNDAAQVLSENLKEIEAHAQRAVYDNGFSYPVRAEITTMYFPTREYDTFSLPAGYYDAFRIIIGDGAGRNWWCVMFPPLCIGASEAQLVETAHEAGLTDKELALIARGEDVYRYEFKLMELVGALKGIFS